MRHDKGYNFVLFVEQEFAAASAGVKALRRAGYQTTGVATFEEAKQQMLLDIPDVLVTRARLAAYNGLHLVLLGQLYDPRFQAVVIADEPDPVLQRDVAQAGAVFLVKPVPSDMLVSVVTHVLAGPAGSPEQSGIELRFERRVTDRRFQIVPGFTPERRVAERRKATPGS